MTIAKALSSAYLPISAVLLSPEMCEAIESESGKIGTFGHGFTYSGHPVAAAVALKTIEIYQERDIVGHVREVAPRFLARLARLGEHPLVGEAKGVGLLAASKSSPTRKRRRASIRRRRPRRISRVSPKRKASSRAR
jgi:4-aminobutyrate---pyruvate transaminase